MAGPDVVLDNGATLRDSAITGHHGGLGAGMRAVRVLAGVAIAGIVASACIPPPPPPPYRLAHLNGTFEGSSSYTNGPECPIALELFFDIEYTVPNPAGEVELDIDGCVDSASGGFTFDGLFILDTEVGTLRGLAEGTIVVGTPGAHRLILTVTSATGEYQGVRGAMRTRLECICGTQPPDVVVPVKGLLVAL